MTRDSITANTKNRSRRNDAFIGCDRNSVVFLSNPDLSLIIQSAPKNIVA
jgi:hypothetical protein